MLAFVLVECLAVTMKAVGKEISVLGWSREVRIVSSDTTLGPYDVFVKLEGPDPDAIARFVSRVIRRVRGVTQTETILTTLSSLTGVFDGSLQIGADSLLRYRKSATQTSFVFRLICGRILIHESNYN